MLHVPTGPEGQKNFLGKGPFSILVPKQPAYRYTIHLEWVDGVVMMLASI